MKSWIIEMTDTFCGNETTWVFSAESESEECAVKKVSNYTGTTFRKVDAGKWSANFGNTLLCLREGNILAL